MATAEEMAAAQHQEFHRLLNLWNYWADEEPPMVIVPPAWQGFYRGLVRMTEAWAAQAHPANAYARGWDPLQTHMNVLLTSLTLMFRFGQFCYSQGLRYDELTPDISETLTDFDMELLRQPRGEV